MAKAAKYKQEKEKKKPLLLQEPPTVYEAKKPLAVADYSYKKLKKIMDISPFTQSEWADMLHLSERTLQRYAKQNGAFEGIYTDRILLLQEMIELGLAIFTDGNAFYAWLKKDKPVMGQVLNFDSLSSERGIQEVIHQLSRIQYGIYT